MDILKFLSSVLPYAAAIVMFLLLIVVHEFGHFIAAKSVGVRVNEFSIGFGPTLFKKKKGDTTYFIKAVPFGGYCALEGEDEQSGDPAAFCNKHPWQRAIVIAAGAVFNIILGFIIIAGTLLPQESFGSTRVAQFRENAVSSNYGLKENDKIIKVNGRRVFTTYDLSYTFTNVKGGSLDLTVVRDGKKIDLSNVKFDTETEEGIDYISVDFWVAAVKKTPLSFLSEAAKTTVSYARVVWFSLVDLVTGKYGISAVSGPVGVTAVIGEAAKRHFTDLFPIIALITINLGIFNLLPLPALDGGRLFFIIIEMIFRRPVPAKYEGWVHAAGFALLIMLMIVITAKDIWGLIKR